MAMVKKVYCSLKMIRVPPKDSISWLIGPRVMSIRLNSRPRAVADTTMGKKKRMRNTWEPF